MYHSNQRVRRMFVVALAVAATVSLAACSTSSTPAPSSSSSAAAKSGGTVTIAGPYSTDSLDPHGTDSAAAGTSLASQSIFARLVKPTTTGKIVGDLATSWKANTTATKWTFTLRKKVVFSDGTPLTSADVVGSFHRAITLAGPVAGNFPDVTVKADGKDGVIFTSTAPEPALLGKLTLLFITKGDAITADFAADPIGEGPYKVKSFTPSQTLVMVPNPKYYGKVPALKQLILRNIPDITARLTALQTGEVQATWGFPDDQAAALQSDTSLVEKAIPSTTVTTMWFNSSQSAVGTAAVRNAIWEAIDFKTIIKELYPNTGSPAKSTVAADVLGYSPETPKKYDPAAAKAALKKAGFNFSQPIMIQYDDSQYTEFLDAVASDLKKVGVNAVPTLKDPATWLADLLALKNWDINFQQLGTPTFDAASNLGRLYTCAAKRTGYCNPDLDKLLNAAGSTSVVATREKDYAAANKIIWDNAVGMYPMDLEVPYAWSTKLKGFTPDPSGLPDLSTVSY